MQDRYVGDVGDFGKYGLLRQLTGSDPTLSLGVIWYRTDEEVQGGDPPNDGRHTTYASEPNAPRFQPCDPELFEAMKQLLRSGTRTLAAVERAGVLPPGTTYVSAHLRAPRSAPRSERLLMREEWLRAASVIVKDRSIVFVDPDNGLEVPSVGSASPRAPKYAFWDDFDKILHAGQSLVAYHHLGRSPHMIEVQRRLSQLEARLSRPVFALRFHRGTSRVFLIAPAPGHDRQLRTCVRGMLDSPWAAHFDWIDAATAWSERRARLP